MDDPFADENTQSGSSDFTDTNTDQDCFQGDLDCPNSANFEENEDGDFDNLPFSNESDTDMSFSGNQAVIASILYGFFALCEATIPVLLMYTVKTMDSYVRNDVYKWAWYIMAWGGVGIYGPVSLLWPLSYAGLGETYVKVANVMGWLGLIMHLTVTFMLNFASENYYKEDSLKYWELWVEMYSYNFIIYIVFYMTKRSLLNDYEYFYST